MNVVDVITEPRIMIDDDAADVTVRCYIGDWPPVRWRGCCSADRPHGDVTEHAM